MRKRKVGWLQGSEPTICLHGRLGDLTCATGFASAWRLCEMVSGIGPSHGDDGPSSDVGCDFSAGCGFSGSIRVRRALLRCFSFAAWSNRRASSPPSPTAGRGQARARSSPGHRPADLPMPCNTPTTTAWSMRTGLGCQSAFEQAGRDGPRGASAGSFGVAGGAAVLRFMGLSPATTKRGPPVRVHFRPRRSVALHSFHRQIDEKVTGKTVRSCATASQKQWYTRFAICTAFCDYKHDKR